MAERAGEVALLDIGIKTGDAPAPHAVDEVAEVVAAAFEFRHLVAVVMKMLAHDGKLLRRSAPEVVIHGRRRILRAVNFTNALPPLVAEPAGQVNLPKLAFVQVLDALLNALRSAALCARLADAVI